MDRAADAWTVGANGVFVGSPSGGWSRLGRFDFAVAALARHGGRILAGGGGGLWEVDPASGSWTQIHDETLTEVLGIAPEGSPVASAYGVACGEVDPEAAVEDPLPLRWRFFSDGLPPDARFTNAVVRDHADAERWIAGTEAGVLAFSRSGTVVERSSLAGFPVRALLSWTGSFWAGTDGHGVWKSADGVSWRRAGTGLDAGTVYCLAAEGDDTLLAGTVEGMFVGDGSGRWRPIGPAIPVVAAACVKDGSWAVGGMPGGLWFSTDRGAGWRQSRDFSGVGAILAPDAAPAAAPDAAPGGRR